jgi:hypothetical protein
VASIGNLAAAVLFPIQMPSSHQTKIIPTPAQRASQIQALCFTMRRSCLTSDFKGCSFVISRKKSAGRGVDGGTIGG